VILAGDFNVNFLSCDKKARELKSILKSADLNPIFIENTRFNYQSYNDSCIDNVCLNCPGRLVSSKIIGGHGLLDHELLYIEVKCSADSGSRYVTKRKINLETMNNLKYALANEDWKEVYAEKDANVVYDLFYSTLKFHFDVHCPNVRSKTRDRKIPKIKWSPRINELTERIALLRDMRGSNSSNIRLDEIKAQMDKCSAQLKAVIKKSITESNELSIVKSDNVCKTTWGIINSIKSEQASFGSVMKLEVQGKLCTDPHLVANEFNNFYINVPATIANNLPSINFNVNLIEPIGNSIFMYDSDVQEITEIINSLTNKKSCGLDEFSNLLVKHINNEVASPFTYVINLCMAQ